MPNPYPSLPSQTWCNLNNACRGDHDQGDFEAATQCCTCGGGNFTRPWANNGSCYATTELYSSPHRPGPGGPMYCCGDADLADPANLGRPGSFDPETALIDLMHNSLTSLPADAFRGLENLTDMYGRAQRPPRAPALPPPPSTPPPARPIGRAPAHSHRTNLL